MTVPYLFQIKANGYISYSELRKKQVVRNDGVVCKVQGCGVSGNDFKVGRRKESRSCSRSEHPV